MVSKVDNNKRIYKNFSYSLMIQLIPLFVISSYLVYEINFHLYQKQMIYYFIAAIAFFVSAFIPWRRIIWWFSPIFYVANLALLNESSRYYATCLSHIQESSYRERVWIFKFY